MGLQVPRRVFTEESKKGVVRAVAGASWRGVSHAGSAQGEPDRRGTLVGRSRPHDDLDTAKVRGVKCVGLHQGQKRDSPGSGVCRA